MSKRVVVITHEHLCECGITYASWGCADCKTSQRVASGEAAERMAEEHRATVHGKKRTRLVLHKEIP